MPDAKHLKPDILIIGAGPIACAFARKLLTSDSSITVTMIDAGAQLTPRPGAHLKNSHLYQKDVNLFTGVIRGHLQTLSVPVDRRPVVSLDPAAASFHVPFIHNNQNPDQDPHRNLGASAATYAVGGMATHWTCACPRLHVNERPSLQPDSTKDAIEWNRIYEMGEEYLHVKKGENADGSSNPEYPFNKSRRHKKVLQVLKEEYKDIADPSAQARSLPLSCDESNDLVFWGASDTVLGDLISGQPTVNADGSWSYQNGRLTIMAQHRCSKLILNSAHNKVENVEILNLVTQQRVDISASTYIMAAGAALTPQILFNSGIAPTEDPDKQVPLLVRLPVGLHLTEQPMAFCQIVLKRDILESMRAMAAPAARAWEPPVLVPDPIGPFIPSGDREPQVNLPYSANRPWHCQIHRDAFSYGELAPNVDGRLIVDLRWFGQTWQDPRNRIMFRSGNTDAFGMPQPTFAYEIRDMTDNGSDLAQLNEELKQAKYQECLGTYSNIQEFDDLKKAPSLGKVQQQQHAMMQDMLRAAVALGGFMPGSEPQFMTPGLTLHVHGTIRMGDDPRRSVVDTYSQVHGIENLYLGGNGVLSIGNAGNPTLSSVSLAIRASEQILKSRSLATSGAQK